MRRLAIACLTLFILPIEASAVTCYPAVKGSDKKCIKIISNKTSTQSVTGVTTYEARVENRCGKPVKGLIKFEGKKEQPKTFEPGRGNYYPCKKGTGCTGPLEWAIGVCGRTTDNPRNQPEKTQVKVKKRPQQNFQQTQSTHSPMRRVYGEKDHAIGKSDVYQNRDAAFDDWLYGKIIKQWPEPKKKKRKKKKPSEPESRIPSEPFPTATEVQKEPEQTRNKKAPTDTFTDAEPARKAAIAPDRKVKKPVRSKSDLRGVWRIGGSECAGYVCLSCTGSLNVTSKIGNNKYRATYKANCRAALKPGGHWNDGTKKRVRNHVSNCTYTLSVNGSRVRHALSGGGPYCKSANYTLSGNTMRAGPWTYSR